MNDDWKKYIPEYPPTDWPQNVPKETHRMVHVVDRVRLDVAGNGTWHAPRYNGLIFAVGCRDDMNSNTGGRVSLHTSSDQLLCSLDSTQLVVLYPQALTLHAPIQFYRTSDVKLFGPRAGSVLLSYVMFVPVNE